MKEKENLEVYEIGYHLLPSVGENLSAEIEKIRTVIVKNNGAVLLEGFPEMKTLAYEIAKKTETKNDFYNKAYFGWFKFEIEADSLSKIHLEIKKNQNILRFLLVKTVRENFPLFGAQRIFPKKDFESIKPIVSDSPELVAKPPVSEAEIDKSIDELLVN